MPEPTALRFSVVRVIPPLTDRAVAFLALLLPTAAAAQTTLVSPNDNGFGFAVVGLGDVNGDGFGDVAVGAPRESVGAVEFAGRVFVFSGATGALIRSHTHTVPYEPASFGMSLAAGQPTGVNTLTRNLIWDNAGLGISRNSASLGITPNGAGNTDGVASFDTPFLYRASGGAGSLFVSGTVAAPMTVEVFASAECDASGYGEGQIFLGSLQSEGGVFEGDVAGVPGPDWRVTTTGTNLNGTTSEFSPCVTPALSGDAATLAVGSGQTPSLDGPSIDVAVTANTLRGTGTERTVCADGTVNPVPDEATPDVLPTTFAVAPYPNPSRGRATVSVDLPTAGAVTADVLDALGRRVVSLWDGPLAAGTHALRLDAALAPGLYVVRVSGPDGVAARRLTVVR